MAGQKVKLATLWIGDALSWLEQLCLTSFIAHGHEVTLFSYGGVANAPDGLRQADAGKVFPASDFLVHGRTGSPAVHADAFRYRMIARTGQTWIDADILCLRPWEFPDRHVFGWEKPGKSVCNAVLGLPGDSGALARLIDISASAHPVPPWFPPAAQAELRARAAAGTPVHVSDLPWGVWGPSAVTHFLRETGEIAHAMPQAAFYPVSFRDRRKLLRPGFDLSDRIGPETYGVHLWNRRLRRRLVAHHGGVPPEGSYLHAALLRHGVDPAAAPIPDVPPGPRPARSLAAVALPVPVPAPPAPAPVAPPGLAADRVQRNPPEAQSVLPLRRPPPGPFRERAEHLERQLDGAGCWLAPPAVPVLDRPRVLAVSAMKNEAPFILEWIAYNRVIGIDHALVYTNDCTDPTVPMLDRLAELGHVTRVDNPFDPAAGMKPQPAALGAARHHPLLRQADWVAVLDVDEFPAIHVGDGTLADLLRAANHPNAISLTWRFFGNGGVAEYVDRPVIAQFTRCAPEVIPKAGVAWGFKTLFRPSEARFAKLGVHRPRRFMPEGKATLRWVNGSGRVMPASLVSGGWRTLLRTFGYRLASLNHYALRSADSYLVKRDRGRVNHTTQDQGLYYWQRRNYIADSDDRMAHLLPRVEEELARLKSDPALADLHAQAVDWHRARIVRLKADPGYGALHADLLRTGLIDASDFIANIAPEADMALQRADPPPAPVPYD